MTTVAHSTRRAGFLALPLLLVLTSCDKRPEPPAVAVPVVPIEPRTALEASVRYEIERVNDRLQTDQNRHMVNGRSVAHRVADAFRARGWTVEVKETEDYGYLRFFWPEERR
jgi:hypothetical protein